MSRLRAASFMISIDGFGAGPGQDLDHPLGVGGHELHGWAISTRTLQQTLFGSDGGAVGIDDDFAARGFANLGAWILGRNMFGAPSAAPGRTSAGGAGGATTRSTTSRSSCSPTMRAHRW